MKIVLKSAFDRFSGYGNDAVDLAVWLTRAGADITVMPTAILPGLPRKFTMLLEKDPRGKKDVLLHFAEPRHLKPDDDAERAGMLRVAYTMWERSRITEDDFVATSTPPWGAAGEHVEKNRLSAWDKVIVTCPMNREAFRPIVPDEVPIDVVPCGIDPADWEFKRRDLSGGRPVRFLMVGMLSGRKNPFAFIDAWREAFEREPNLNATLHLHTLAAGIHPALANVVPNMTISTSPVDREGLVKMYHDHDVIVSTSRGEGNNKPAMEFMATGGVPMATDWSGHQNWLHRDCTVPLPGRLEQSPYAAWAEDFTVDHESLVEQIIRVATDRHELPMMGERAHRYAATALSWEHVCERLLQSIARAR